jgi:hypothetical protein
MYHTFKILKCGLLIDDYIKYKLSGLTKVLFFFFCNQPMSIHKPLNIYHFCATLKDWHPYA